MRGKVMELILMPSLVVLGLGNARSRSEFSLDDEDDDADDAADEEEEEEEEKSPCEMVIAALEANEDWKDWR